MSSACPNSPRPPDPGLRCAPPSRSDVLTDVLATSPRRANVVAPDPLADRDFRAWFLDHFPAYLGRRFAYPEQVAVAFKVRQSTACNWMEGVNAPSGFQIVKMLLADPGFADWWRTAWEGQ